MSVGSGPVVPTADGVVSLRRVPAVDLAACVAACVASGGRFLHLCDVPGGWLLALCDTAQGPQAWLSPFPRDPGTAVPRLSASGVLGALHAESRLAGAGLPWATPPPDVGVHGRGVFTFPLGPVRADIAESAAWRLFVMGDEVLGLQLGFGYKVRRVETAMTVAGPAAGLEIAERVTGTSPVAHALAYSQAWESAVGGDPSPAVHAWRGVLAELERLHSHLGDLAGLANSTGLAVAAAELWVLKEQVLRACARLVGNRYLRGAVALSGPGAPPDRRELEALPGGLRALHDRLRGIVAALEGSTSFLDRLHGTGRLSGPVVAAYQPVGPVGRAAGLGYDVRQDRPYAAYTSFGAPAPALERAADAWARYRVRVSELYASMDWLERRLCDLPVAGRAPTNATVAGAGRPSRPPEGIFLGRAEAPRGELLYLVGTGTSPADPWVRVRPPSAVNWATLPHAVSNGNVLQDVPIIDASFALSVAAMDR